MQKSNIRKRRHSRIRAKIFGTAERPRLAVFKSNRYIYGQIIDDSKGKTLVANSSLGKGKTDAKAVGVEIAKLAKAKGFEKVVFDRGGFLYTGQVKLFADGAREGGLIF
jgi:large subunit ribosomal protein L18